MSAKRTIFDRPEPKPTGRLFNMQGERLVYYGTQDAHAFGDRPCTLCLSKEQRQQEKLRQARLAVRRCS